MGLISESSILYFQVFIHYFRLIGGSCLLCLKAISPL